MKKCVIWKKCLKAIFFLKIVIYDVVILLNTLSLYSNKNQNKNADKMAAKMAIYYKI